MSTALHGNDVDELRLATATCQAEIVTEHTKHVKMSAAEHGSKIPSKLATVCHRKNERHAAWELKFMKTHSPHQHVNMSTDNSTAVEL